MYRDKKILLILLKRLYYSKLFRSRSREKKSSLSSITIKD
jgi:hypothetical protein